LLIIQALLKFTCPTF